MDCAESMLMYKRLNVCFSNFLFDVALDDMFLLIFQQMKIVYIRIWQSGYLRLEDLRTSKQIIASMFHSFSV